LVSKLDTNFYLISILQFAGEFLQKN